MSTELTPVLSPYLTVNDADQAIEFYKEVFDAKEKFRLIDKTTGKIGHAQLEIHGRLFMVSDEFPGASRCPASLGGCPVTLVLAVDDPDHLYEKAVAVGARSERPPTDEFYGYRVAILIDPAGYRWMLMKQFEAVSPEEMQRRWDKVMEDALAAEV